MNYTLQSNAVQRTIHSQNLENRKRGVPMLKHKDHFHGSDLEKIEEIYHIRKEDITSFSANVNPLGISPMLRDTLSKHVDAISTYPDRDYTKLRKSICAYTGAEFDNIIVGNGSTELISLFIQTTQPQKALILGPTYSEYEREIALQGGQTLYYPLKEDDLFQINVEDFCSQLNDSLDLLVLCNPNNPTSTAITRKEMRKILDRAMQYGISVMVDETYEEFTDAGSKISSIPLTNNYNNLIVLRGISKFFAAPGLRLGYAVTGNPDLLKYINTKKNPWTINSLAEIAGCIMFSDKEYIEKTRALITSERNRLYDLLNTWEYVKVYPSCSNFLLVKILREDVTSEMVFDHCIRKGLMIRDCSTFPFLDNSFIRFCVMSPEKNNALMEALRELDL